MTPANIDISRVMIDFDETFIKEQTLVTWVFHIFFHSELSFSGKIVFLIKALFMGAISILASGCKATSECGVRIAYMAFKGIKTATMDDMIKKGALNLNKNTMMILRDVMKKTRHKPLFFIVSQGSPHCLIRRFLKKEDVMIFFKSIGIDPQSIIIHANNMESENGKFTGKIRNPVETKFSRIEKMVPGMVFIGDGKDEKLLKNLLIRDVRFINRENENIR